MNALKIAMRLIILIVIAAFFWQDVACGLSGYEEDRYGNITGYYSNEVGLSAPRTYKPAKVYKPTKKITVIFEGADGWNRFGHPAIRIDNKIYELQKEGAGRGLVKDNRSYSNILNNNRKYKEVEVNFLSSQQVKQLEMNLKDSVGDKINYNYPFNNSVNWPKDQFGKVGVRFPNDFMDTPDAFYKQTIQMNKTYITPSNWRTRGQRYKAIPYLRETIIKGTIQQIKTMERIMPQTYTTPYKFTTPIIEPIKTPSYRTPSYNPAFSPTYNPFPTHKWGK